MASVLIAVHVWGDPLTVEFWAISRRALEGSGLFRLFTAVLRHADVLHLAGNVAGLVVLGLLLEPRLGAAGLLTIVAAGALGGALASALVDAGASIGASGGVYALLGAWLVLGGRASGRRFARPRLPVRLWLLLGTLLLVENVWPQLPWPFGLGSRGAGVDWAAHFGGAVTGALLGCAIRATTDAWSMGNPRWVTTAASLLAMLYAGGAIWGLYLYGGGSPEALGKLSEGPAKWIAINNRAWEAALSPAAQEAELAQWREQMQRVVDQTEDQPEFVDTLATLQHRLGAHRQAVALEREVSWAHETPEYVQQFARFAWSALKDAGPLAKAERSRVDVAPSGDDVRIELRVPRANIPVQGLELDVLCWVEDVPTGLLRMTLGRGGSGRVVVPAQALALEGPRAPPSPECAVIHEQPATRAGPLDGMNARYWRLDVDGSQETDRTTSDVESSH